MSADNIGEAHDLLIARIAGRQSSTKEEAEILALEAGALQSLAVAEKSRHELNDSISATARAQRWVQFVVGVAGIGGAAALGAWAVKYHDEQKQLEGKTAALVDREKSATEREESYKHLEQEYGKVGERINLALNIEQVIQNEIERQSLLLTQETLRVEDQRVRAETLREEQEKLRMEIAGLSPQLRAAISGETPADSGLKELVAEPQGPTGLETAATIAEPRAAETDGDPSAPLVAGDPPVPEAGEDPPLLPAPPEGNPFISDVENLFDENAGIRGQAYKDLTTGKDRTNQALLNALLAVGEVKFQRLERLPSDAKSELPLLKRGLENVLVTLRDISRTVTKLPEPNREKVLAFANKLKLSPHGFEKEAGSLMDWLNNGNNK